jgi:hypothetical protein
MNDTNISHIRTHCLRKTICENTSDFNDSVVGESLFTYIKNNYKNLKIEDAQKRVIKDDEQKKYICNYCLKAFSARQNVYRHQKICRNINNKLHNEMLFFKNSSVTYYSDDSNSNEYSDDLSESVNIDSNCTTKVIENFDKQNNKYNDFDFNNTFNSYNNSTISNVCNVNKDKECSNELACSEENDYIHDNIPCKNSSQKYFHINNFSKNQNQNNIGHMNTIRNNQTTDNIGNDNQNSYPHSHSNKYYTRLPKKRKIPIIINNSNIIENINQQNNNCIVYNTYVNINPFQKEDLSHIDKVLMLDMIFNNEDDDGLFSKNIFQKIHTELIRLPQNLNMYLEGFHSKSILIYKSENRSDRFEKETTMNAIFLRVKSIYEKVRDIYTDIYYNYSHLFYEIYDRYKSKKAFNFTITDFEFTKKMYDCLIQAIDFRFEQYLNQSNNSLLVKYRKDIQKSIKMDLVDSRENIKNILKLN